MSWKKDFRQLLVKLSQDPKIKVAMEGIRESTGGASTAKVGIAWQLVTLTARFAGKKRARAIAEVIDVVTFLVTLSLIVKQNIFDRPEVRAFFAKTWDGLSTRTRHTLSRAQTTVARRLGPRKAKKA